MNYHELALIAAFAAALALTAPAADSQEVLKFIFDGTHFNEVSRTTAM